MFICQSLSVLAWRIPGTGEPGGLPSMGSHRVGHDWSDLAAAAASSSSSSPLSLHRTCKFWVFVLFCFFPYICDTISVFTSTGSERWGLIVLEKEAYTEVEVWTR